MNRLALGALILLTIVARLAVAPQGELTSDDAKWLLMAKAGYTRTHPLVIETPSSVGTPIPAFPLYLHELAFLFSPRIGAIQAMSAIFSAATVALVFLSGLELSGLSAATLAGLLTAFSPVLLLFYSSKLDESVYAPFFAALALLLYLRGKLVASFSAFVGGVLVHASSAVFGVAYAWRLAWRGRDEALERRALLALAWLVALAAALAAVVGLPNGGLAPLVTVADLLPGFNPYLESHLGIREWSSGAWRLLSLEGALVVWWFFSSKENKLSRWLCVPLLTFTLVTLPFKSIPHQWALGFFPALWLAVALAIEGLPRRRRFRELAGGVLVLVSIVSCFRGEAFNRATGGRSWHLATVKVRHEIAARILALDSSPHVFLAVDPAGQWRGYGAGGWTAAFAFARDTAPGAPALGRRFVIDEPWGLGYANETASHLDGVEVEHTPSLRVFELRGPTPAALLPIATVNPFEAR